MMNSINMAPVIQRKGDHINNIAVRLREKVLERSGTTSDGKTVLFDDQPLDLSLTRRSESDDRENVTDIKKRIVTTAENLFISGHNSKAAKQVTGKKKFVCPVCNKASTSPSNLKKHQQIHSDERPYRCDLCPKAFKQLKGLRQHRPIHSDMRAYRCDLCQKAFKQFSCLYHHRRFHSKEKPYDCPDCNKAFKSSYELQSHQKIHSDERSYQCVLCPAAFKQAGGLRQHRRIYHP